MSLYVIKHVLEKIVFISWKLPKRQGKLLDDLISQNLKLKM